jgi:hypothetical protein
LPVSSTSANTGVAPAVTTAFTDATNVKLGTITSPVIPCATSDTNSADVQEFIATAYAQPTEAANSSSNAATSDPDANHPDRRTAVTAATSSSPIDGTLSGTFMRVRQGAGPHESD